MPIDPIFATQFHSNLTFQYQQEKSVLRGYTMEQQCNGEADTWDRVGVTNATEKVTRATPTPNIDVPFSRRKIFLRDWHNGYTVDKQDIIRVISNPQSAATRAIAASIHRQEDSLIYNAFGAAVLTGKNGTDTVTFDADWPNGNRAAGEGDEDFSGAAIDIDDLLTLKRQFDENSVPDSGRHIIMPPGGAAQLLTSVEVGSADYNTVKTLVRGEVGSFLGFVFHQLPAKQMTIATGTDYYCYAWHEMAMGYSVGIELETKVDERPDISYAVQTYARFTAAAVRVQGEGVIQFLINNAA